MFERMSMVVGAGMVTAGVSAAMLAGAGVAIAATEPGAGGETSTSDTSGAGSAVSDSDTAASDTETQNQDADDDADEASEDAPGDEISEDEVDDADAEPDPAAEVDGDDGEEAGEDGEEAVADAADTDRGGADEASVVVSDPTSPPTEPEVATADPVAKEAEDVDIAAPAVDVAAPAAEDADTSADAEPATPEPISVTEPVQAVAPLAMVSAVNDGSVEAKASTPKQTLLSLVGTIVFNLYSFAIRVFGGPALLPAGSTVTVRSSMLEIDCGDGYEVPADWYVPEGATPTRLIYLQHGFLAAGPFYSYTAARLAEATHSIVVTTSLTSNFLACDGCWVGGSPMHKAVADLFVDGNTALADSALAAGYSATLLAGVEKIVLMGHSAGGGLAAGAAGYMTGNGTIDRLAGVVMLDGVGFGDVLPEALAKLPDEVPIYNLAGKAYYWNMNGAAGAALEQERPGQFNGVRLVGGLHSDSMSGGNPLVQFGLNLVTGFSKAENVKAAEILSAAWVNDMFAGAPTEDSPYYGAVGDLLDIDTSRGTAQAYVVPGPPEKLTLVDELFQFFANLIFGIDFAVCAAPLEVASVSQAGVQSENYTPNTALSLDGRTKAGQSIGQHVCTG